MGPQLQWSRKKHPNLKQCRRSRNFASNYFVVSFRVMLEFFLCQKRRTVMPQLDFLISLQNAERRPPMLWPLKKLPNLKQCQKSRKFTLIQLLGGLVSSNVRVFFPTKVEQWCSKLHFLVPSQNAEKGATIAVASKETTRLRTVLKVSNLHIQLLYGLVSSNVRVFLPTNVERWCPNFTF